MSGNRNIPRASGERLPGSGCWKDRLVIAMSRLMQGREVILASRWLRPFAHLFGHPSLWHCNRRSVPRALAAGLFAGFVLPLGQFVLAAFLAVSLRANVPIAVGTTLVTNPLTVPPIYFAAYKTGAYLLRQSPAGGSDEAAANMAAKLLDVTGPIAVGLVVFALVGAVLGFVLGTAWWRLRLAKRWRRRRNFESADPASRT